jgi:hypothetical protein
MTCRPVLDPDAERDLDTIFRYSADITFLQPTDSSVEDEGSLGVHELGFNRTSVLDG